MTHLRPKQEYIDRYDRITIDDCRWRVEFHQNYKPEKPDDVPGGWAGAVGEIALHYDLLFTTLYWWEKKEETIREWMEHDEQRDRLLETARPPEGVRCGKCWTPLVVQDKSIHDWDGKGDRVLFFFSCPSGCLPHRTFFEDGEERRVKRPACPTCQTELNRTHERVENKKIITTDTCPKCGHMSKEELELGDEEEKPDPNFEKDRERFCLTPEQGRKAQDERHQLKQVGQLVDDWKEKEKHKEDYAAVAKLRKLNVLELEKVLAPVLGEAGYVRLQFGTPDVGKDFFLPLTVYDDKGGREERASCHDLSKALRKALADTNWRLMSDGVAYRLGVLTGRLRAYEREEDLLALVRQRA